MRVANCGHWRINSRDPFLSLFNMPKQFMQLNGRSVLSHSLELIRDMSDEGTEVVLVMNEVLGLRRRIKDKDDEIALMRARLQSAGLWDMD